MSNNKRFWTKEKIVKQLKLSKKYKLDLKDFVELYKKGCLCNKVHIRTRVGSLKKACELAGKIYIGKTYEGIFGVQGAKERIKKTQMKITKWNKENILIALKKLYKKYGYIRPINLSKYSKLKLIPHPSVIQKYFGKVDNAYKEIGVINQGYYWSNTRILKTLRELYGQNGPFAKSDINIIFLKNRQCCGIKLIRDRFGSLDEAAEQAGIKFKETDLNTIIGNHEKRILDEIEMKNNIIIERQKPVLGFYLDGYDNKNKVVYEVDEPFHKYTQFDLIRENKIKEHLGCDVQRIKVGW